MLVLRKHLAGGRLTLEELTERMTAALATTRTAGTHVPLRELPVPAAQSRRRPSRFILAVVAFGLFTTMDVCAPEGIVDLWRAPHAWGERSSGEAIKGIRRGEHEELGR